MPPNKADNQAPRPGRAAPQRARDPQRDSWGQALRLAEEERLWRQLLGHLPENARLLWHALGDMRQFWRVLHSYGGQNLRVPRVEPKEVRHPLRRALGLACLRKLMAAFGGTCVYVPRCHALMARLRQHDIIADFSRSTGRGVSSTAAVAELARRHGVSDRRIWQILKKEGSAPSQARVLYRLGSSAAVCASKEPISRNP